MEKITIKNAIIKVLSSKESLSPKEIYGKIIAAKLFEFNSKDPIAIVNSVLRNSCAGIDLKKSSLKREFIFKDGKFSLN